MLARGEEPRMYDELVKTNQSLCEGKQPVFNKVEKGLITEPLCLPKAKRLDQASVLSISTSRWSRRDKLSKRKQPNYLPGTFQNLRNLSRTVAREVAGSKPRKARLTPPPPPPPTHTHTHTCTHSQDIRRSNNHTLFLGLPALLTLAMCADFSRGNCLKMEKEVSAFQIHPDHVDQVVSVVGKCVCVCVCACTH